MESAGMPEKEFLESELFRRLEKQPFIADRELKRFISDLVGEHISGSTPVAFRIQLEAELFHAIRGMDVLDPLLEDPEITEIMVNGPAHIFAEKGGRLYETGVHFSSGEKLEMIIQRIVGQVNRRVNESNPIADARLADGSRVNVVLPPVSLSGPVLTIRKFSKSPYSMERLIQNGALSQELAEHLKDLVLTRKNLFISGGTGTGKTTFLNALSGFIPETERIITIEDSAELQLQGLPNLVSMEARKENVEGQGEISIRDLLVCALRMRPDRIIVGECRAAEALDMLQAMNSGHSGSMSTGHANSAKDMLYRLETMTLSAGSGIPLPAIQRQISSALDVLIHLARTKDGKRYVESVYLMDGFREGEYCLRALYQDGKILGGI